MSVNMVATVARLDWRGWLNGVIGAFVSGGAVAISTALAAPLADPGHDLNVLKLTSITALISAIVSLAKFLVQHPTPDAESAAVPATPPKVN
jgi:hypothetical protein